MDPRSHVTWTELRRIVRELRIGPGDAFLDLGCGHGGPCLWVARATRAAVVGIDLAEEGAQKLLFEAKGERTRISRRRREPRRLQA